MALLHLDALPYAPTLAMTWPNVLFAPDRRGLLCEHRLFRHQRFLAQIYIGSLPLSKVARVIEILATQVALVVRRATAAP